MTNQKWRVQRERREGWPIEWIWITWPPSRLGGFAFVTWREAMDFATGGSHD
jgi:hypothetical protein